MAGNHRHIHEEIKKKMVELSATYKQCNIAKILGVNRKTVHCAVNLATATGKVVRTPPAAGRPRNLNGLHLAFLESLIERTPDTYISELQNELESAFGKSVSRQTIVRGLKRRGFTRKKVSNSVRPCSTLLRHRS
ncbi:hypothetical protein FIBSPDRAFT_723428 [Athelia psychrophila]|uniref:Transposase Tc1-like domain-containing protein n=1 Tax=Athelia psychrophila TaxID=1759441 RepID=A0A166URB6_9AGAM|nr:hypothetical protein FIBSPDRAFT_723428 [Fibularhizoctonia sp. CBS 109695]